MELMHNAELAGCSILLVEDQPLIALDITQELEAAGAMVTSTNTLEHALILVEHDGLAAAILDHGLPDGDSSLLCGRLKARKIPFIIYSGHSTVGDDCESAIHIAKPAGEGELSSTLARLIRDAPAAGAQGPPVDGS
jgi:DNA-binding response OmpR family regulator